MVQPGANKMHRRRRSWSGLSTSCLNRCFIVPNTVEFLPVFEGAAAD
jgi:hypothetical protein